MLQEKVEKLLDNALTERPDLFLIDLKVAGGSEIHITLDGDHHVSVEDCIFISRAIEHNLDRDEEDFSLQVTSAGVGTPLLHPRQYLKNVGRTLEVRDVEGAENTGLLTMADDHGITLEWKAREPKPVGKGKVTVKKKWELAYDKIETAKVIVKF